MIIRWAGILAVASFVILGFPGCFDSEPKGIRDWASIGEVAPNGFWVFGGVLERFMIFSEKQREIQSQCAGVRDINCDGTVDAQEAQ